MQIRVAEVPSQVAEQSGTANQRHSRENNDRTQDGADGGMNEHDIGVERLRSDEQIESLQSNHTGNMPRICINGEPRTVEQAQEQSKGDGEELDITKEKRKKKKKGKHKEVKFTVQVLDHAEGDLGEGRKGTSQGR